MIARIVFRTLFSGRIGVVTKIAISAFFLGGFCSFVPIIFCFTSNSVGSSTANVLSSILLGIGTSTLAASLVTTLEHVKSNQITKLVKLFAIDTGKKIAIVIPHFGADYFNEKKENTESVRDLSGITGISYADFVASKYLVGLFQKFNIGLPDVITDHEAIEIVTNKERVKKYCTFI